jgi:hypothetical protein
MRSVLPAANGAAAKGWYSITFRTLHGDVEPNSPRSHRCRRQGMGEPTTVSPPREMVPGHAAPERLHPETRWASLVPYAAAAGLSADVLPIASGPNAA